MESGVLCTQDYIFELVQKHSDMVLRLAITYLKNITDAEDVCQNVFIKIFEQNKTFENPEHEKAWIIRVTINACKDVIRSPWKKRFCRIDEVALPIKDKEYRGVVSSVLELPIKYRSVIYLHYFENYSTLEIAKLLNIKDATVRTQLKRARGILKTKLDGGFENEW
jgi:RNA polymerase sigma factor (sigma-70 family)